MLKVYARYIYTHDYIAKRLGNDWHEVTQEYAKYYPSGRHTTIVIDGLAVKACYCEIAQVFTKDSK